MAEFPSNSETHYEGPDAETRVPSDEARSRPETSAAANSGFDEPLEVNKMDEGFQMLFEEARRKLGV